MRFEPVIDNSTAETVPWVLTQTSHPSSSAEGCVILLYKGGLCHCIVVARIQICSPNLHVCGMITVGHR